jgi:ligand-binding sensor domain-containing protein
MRLGEKLIFYILHLTSKNISMKKFYFAFISLCIFFQVNYTSAQPGWTVYNSSNTNLASAVYRSVAFDQNGNLWTGGNYAGLYKFNGSTWTKYSSISSGLIHDDIRKIIIDNSNNVWSATYKGISVFNGTSFINYDTTNAGFDGYSVYNLGKDINGVIWIASNTGTSNKGITTYDGNTWTNLSGYPSQINGQEMEDFAFTPANVAWIAGSGITKYTGGIFTFYPFATTGLWSSDAVEVDSDGNIWAAGFDGVLKYDGSNWTFYSSVTHFGLTSNTLFGDIYADGNILWISSTSGLLKVNRTNGMLLANYNSGNSPLSIVTEITKDSNGFLWFSTQTGIVKMDPTLVGINEISENELKVFPNPSATGKFEIALKNLKKCQYKIVNLNGEIIQEGQLTEGNSKVDIESFANGIYFLKIITSDFIQNIKIAKN